MYPGNKNQRPERRELETYATLKEISRAYDVGIPCARRWVSEAGIYDKFRDRSNAGKTGSPAARKLEELDPDTEINELGEVDI